MSTNTPLTDTSTLRVGDVVQIAVELEDRQRGGGTFWWKRFAAVTWVTSSRRKMEFRALTLKLHPDMEKDERVISFDESSRSQVVTKLPEPWPQGVAAMHMKLLAQGIIKLDDG